jgi:hypothetical protein
MQAKLTLRLDEDLITQAKRYARDTGKSLSQIVADYFRLLSAEAQRKDSLPPVVQSLKGCLRDASVDEEDYRRYLEEKYL